MAFRVPSGSGGGSSTFIGLTDVPASYSGAALQVVRVNAGETGLEFAVVSGTGDVVGPASATDNAIVRFDGTSGKLIQNYTSGAPTVSDTGAITATQGGSLTGTWSNLGTVTTVDINGGTLDGVIIGGASAAAATVTTLVATTVNGNTITTGTGTLTLGAGSSLITSATNSITLTSTGATNVTLPTTGTLATLAGSETLSNKTLTTPTIASFTNAAHDHDDAAGGGQLNATNVFSAGTVPTARLGSGTADGTTFLRGDQTWATPSGSGDVVGPASATDNALARFDSTTGKLIQNSAGILDDTGALTGITVNANVITAGTVATARLGSGTADGTTFLRGDQTWATPAGSGDVVGPASATDNAIARYDSTTGKLIQNSVVTIADTTGAIAGTQSVSIGANGIATGTLLMSGTTSGTVTIQTAAAAGTYTLTLPTDDGGASQFLQTNGSGVLTWATPSGSGDVVGPASATDNAIVRFDSTTGKLIQDSAVIIADTTGNMSGMQSVTIGVTGTATGTLLLKGTTSGTVTLQTADAAGTYTLTLPTDDGTTGQVLTTNGSGVLSWGSGGGGGVAMGTVQAVAMNYANTWITALS